VTSVVRLLAFVVSVIYTVALSFGDGWAHKFIAQLPSAAVILALAFDKWAWKWPGILSLVGRPYLQGTWAVTLTPDGRSLIPEGGNRGPIDGYICIEQTFFTLHITQYTRESASDSTASKFTPKGESKGQQTLAFLYRNEPKQQHQHRSPAHAGACELRVSGTEPREMEGRYWTGRFTAGDMTLRLLDRDPCYGSFAELHEKFGSRG
jgi:hypothetical protein